MKTARFEFDELPFQTLARFGLTQEMIEDLPMRVLDELCEGRHSPVLPVRVSDENGKTVESRTRLVFYRMENGQVDVLFYPVLKSSPLDRYDREQQKQLLAGKAILADTPTEDGRHTKAFVQIDPETKQVMSVPTPIIGRNLQVLAEELHMGTAEINGMQHGDPVTVEVLDSERRIDIGLHPEIARELAERQRQEEELLRPLENPMPQEDILHGTDAAVDGRDLPLLDERKGWYREEMYGREVEVGQIGVHPAQAEGKYVMTAVIDGRVVSHEITQRDYDRFLAVDDYHRMKLFSKIFSEVEMKPRPETQRGLGVKIFAALTAGAVVTAGVAHGLHHHRHAPEIYGGHYGGPPRPYFKPGVDTPRDVAIRAFEAEMNREADDMRRGR